MNNNWICSLISMCYVKSASCQRLRWLQMIRKAWLAFANHAVKWASTMRFIEPADITEGFWNRKQSQKMAILFLNQAIYQMFSHRMIRLRQQVLVMNLSTWLSRIGRIMKVMCKMIRWDSTLKGSKKLLKFSKSL